MKELLIRDLNARGQGVAADESGLVHFVDGALPGETVVVETVERKQNYAVARLVSLRQASPDRTTPRCAVFGRCGGCQLQHWSRQAELNWKEKRVANLLHHVGKVENMEKIRQPILHTGEAWQTRLKASFPVAGDSEQPQIGFYARGSHRIVDHHSCDLIHETADLIREAARQLIRQQKIQPYNEKEHSGLLRHLVVRTALASKKVQVTLVATREDTAFKSWFAPLAHVLEERGQGFTLAGLHLNIQNRRSNVILGEETRLLAGAETIEEDMNGLRFRLAADTFFQVNPAAAALLFQVLAEQAGGLLQSGEAKEALDLYCGSGAIALHLAREGLPTLGVERSARAILEAKENARLNDLNNVRFQTADATEFTQKLSQEGHFSDLVVLDPPRRGVDPRLLRTLLNGQKPRSIFYVSCDPATLARDLALLADGFQPIFVQPVDFFPQTTHVETVVLMSRVEK